MHRKLRAPRIWDRVELIDMWGGEMPRNICGDLGERVSKVDEENVAINGIVEDAPKAFWANCRSRQNN